jgi:hypothetical protein
LKVGLGSLALPAFSTPKALMGAQRTHPHCNAVVHKFDLRVCNELILASRDRWVEVGYRQ